MKVTFKLSNGRSHTHRGRVYVDGDTADVSARERDKLQARGVIAKPRSFSRKAKASDSE